MILFYQGFVQKWRHGLRVEGVSRFCDNSTKAIVLKSVTKGGEGNNTKLRDVIYGWPLRKTFYPPVWKTVMQFLTSFFSKQKQRNKRKQSMYKMIVNILFCFCCNIYSSNIEENFGVKFHYVFYWHCVSNVKWFIL